MNRLFPTEEPARLAWQSPNALDANDYAALRDLSAELRNCTDALPRSVCVSLGLPRAARTR